MIGRYLHDLRRLALVLGGEGLQSGLHFALTITLAALLPAPDYGLFAFVLTLGGVAIVYMRSLTAMPASTYLGRSRREIVADFHERAFAAAALCGALVATVAGGLTLAAFAPAAAAPGAAVIGLWSLRSHARTVGFARGRGGAVTAADAVFAAVGAAASAAAIALFENRLPAVLSALALANAAGLAAIFLLRRTSARVDFGRRARRFYFGLFRRLAWSLYSVTAAVAQGQGMAFLVIGFAGPAAFAPIAAMLALFAPLRIFALSLSNTLQPEIARLVAANDEAGWRRLKRRWTVKIWALALLYGDCGLLAIPHLHLRSAQGQPLLGIGSLAFALYAIVLAYLLPRILLEVRMRFQAIAVSTTVGALIGLAATAVLLWRGSLVLALLGAVLGEAIVAVIITRIAARPFERASRDGPPSPHFVEAVSPP